MNDSLTDFEAQLRAARPARLPESLRLQLAQPPVLATALAAERPAGRSKVIAWLMPAAAAAALVAVMLVAMGGKGAAPASGRAPLLAGSRESRVTGVRPLGVVTDDRHRLWRLVEVDWVDTETVVSAPHAVAMRHESPHRAIVPVAIAFD